MFQVRAWDIGHNRRKVFMLHCRLNWSRVEFGQGLHGLQGI